MDSSTTDDGSITLKRKASCVKVAQGDSDDEDAMFASRFIPKRIAGCGSGLGGGKPPGTKQVQARRPAESSRGGALSPAPKASRTGGGPCAASSSSTSSTSGVRRDSERSAVELAMMEASQVLTMASNELAFKSLVAAKVKAALTKLEKRLTS